jgi:BirA family biotin operon repressor/biotin-[acetyl-CoA-carboxylase] ligase
MSGPVSPEGKPLELKLPGLPPEYRLAAFEILGSTNDEAKRLAREEGAVHGTLVWAMRQEAGKGRRGRTWVSPEGNVYASLILRPECATATAAQLSFVAAGALADALQPLLPEAVCCCKWPNDVLIDDRKVAGILLESETDGSALSGRLPVSGNFAVQRGWTTGSAGCRACPLHPGVQDLV